MPTLIAQGAEAKLFIDKDTVIKDRFKKQYRHEELDLMLRKTRTRREAKILKKLEELNFPAPLLIGSDEKKMVVRMGMVNGPKLRDVLHKNPFKYSEELGRKIGILHQHNIIHGDLTTSNMILNKEIFFIDFGLSFISQRVEDKAVDLHLLYQALESKHYKIADKCFKAVLKGYHKAYPHSQLVLDRFQKVEARGRNKEK